VVVVVVIRPIPILMYSLYPSFHQLKVEGEAVGVGVGVVKSMLLLLLLWYVDVIY
jgi:hypothetical protein